MIAHVHCVRRHDLQPAEGLLEPLGIRLVLEHVFASDDHFEGVLEALTLEDAFDPVTELRGDDRGANAGLKKLGDGGGNLGKMIVSSTMT